MTEERYAHYQTTIPVRHRRKVPFNPDVISPSGFGEHALELRRLDNELDRYILKASDYSELLLEAWAVNIHRSVSLEGNPLSLNEVRQVAKDSLKNRRVEKMDQPRQEVFNHIAVRRDLGFWKSAWTPELMRRLHGFLLGGGLPDDRAGEYRDVDGAIYNSHGEETMITAPADHVLEELTSLLEWRNTRAALLFPVVAASVFFHEFESIHPFSNGNGRMGRVLFQIMLQTQGLPNSHLCLVEEELMRDLNLYYGILAWTDSSGSYTDLVDFFTDSVLKSYQKADRRLSRKDLLSTGMGELSKRLLVKAKHRGDWFSISEAEQWVSPTGHQTVGRHLNELVEADVLELRGATRTRRYRFKDPVRIWAEGPGGAQLPTDLAGLPSA